MQATDSERSPGSPSLIVTARRRFTPQGTSFRSAGGDAGIALDAAFRVAVELHIGHVWVLLKPLMMRQRVHLVSCICVTES